jgi:hypothetical protein
MEKVEIEKLMVVWLTTGIPENVLIIRLAPAAPYIPVSS